MVRQTRRSHLVGLASAAWLTSGVAQATEPKDYFGVWSGTLEDSTGKTRIRIIITSETAARFVVIDQGAVEFRATGVDLKPDSVTLDFGNGEQFKAQLLDANTLSVTSKEWAVTTKFTRGDLWAPKPLAGDSLKKARQSSGAPAMALAYAKASGRITVQADGLRSSDDAVPVTTGDRWYLASVGKSMTATLVARLVEAGGVSWDASVADVLGASVSDMQDVYKRTTFRHLLSHHAGLKANIENADFLTFTRDRLDDPRAERLRYAGLALKQAPVAAPGAKMVYANNGYVVAAAMLEAVYGQSWETLIQRHVFQPLGVTSAGFGPPGTPGQLDQPLGHLTPPNGAALVPGRPGGGQFIDNVVAMDPAGGVHMALVDLAAYLRAHLNRPESFLERASWTTLHTPPFTPEYALGWYVEDGGVLSHGGTTPRWQANVAIDPSAGVIAAAIANARTPAIMTAVTELRQSAMLSARA